MTDSILDNKDVKKVYACVRCQKLILSEEHHTCHECQPKIAEITGTLEERKQLLFAYYKKEYVKSRTQLFERVFPVFSYEALHDVGNAVASLPQMVRAKHKDVEQIVIASDLDLEKKHATLTDQYEKKIIKIAKTIRCQTCQQPAKFYCCHDGCFCSERCQQANLHFIDCFRELSDPDKDASLPKIKVIPKLRFFH